MVSVTSEVLANASFQGAPARSARPDSESVRRKRQFRDAGRQQCGRQQQRQSRAGCPRTQRPPRAAPTIRKPHPTTASRDNAAASDKAASDKAARNDSNDRDAAAKARDDGKADTKADAKADTAPSRKPTRIEVRRAEVRRSPTRPTQASSGDDAAATDQTEAAQDGTAVVTANAIARRQSRYRRAGSDRFRDACSRQGDRAACDRRRGDRRLRFARQRDRAGRARHRRRRRHRHDADCSRERQDRRRQDQPARRGRPGRQRRRPLPPTPPSQPALRRPLQRSQRRPPASKATAQLKNAGRREGRRATAGEQDGTTDTADAPQHLPQTPSLPPSRRRPKPRASRKPRTASSRP